MLGASGVMLRVHARSGSARLLARSLVAGRLPALSSRLSPVHITPSLAVRNLSLWSGWSSKSSVPPAPAEPEPILPTQLAESQAVTPETVPANVAEPAPGELLSDPAGVFDGLVDSAHTAVASVPAPLHWGDLTALGLTGWSPIGLSVQMVELIQVSTGMSWFSTIVAFTILARAACVPFAVMQQRNTARMAPIQPRLMELNEELQKIKGTQDVVAIQRIVLEQRKLYKDANVSLGQLFIMPFAQLPISLGAFFAVKRITAAPIESLHFSGIGHLIPMYADLTVPDPLYILPIASCVLMNAMFSVMGKDMIASTDRTTVGAMLAAFRAMSVVSIPVMGSLTIGMNVHVITGALAISAQMLVLRIPSVRAKLGIAPLPVKNEKPPTVVESFKLLSEWWQKKFSPEARLEARGPPRKW